MAVPAVRKDAASKSAVATIRFIGISFVFRPAHAAFFGARWNTEDQAFSEPIWSFDFNSLRGWLLSRNVRKQKQMSFNGQWPTTSRPITASECVEGVNEMSEWN